MKAPLIRVGIDHNYYLVFENSYSLDVFMETCDKRFLDCRISNFGQYENALQINAEIIHSL